MLRRLVAGGTRRWIRWVAVAAAGGLSAGVLAGCSLPAGVDGKLVDDWAAVSEPKSFTPPAEVCHDADFTASASLASFNPVECTKPHRTETIFVGTFTAAGLSSPPASGSDELRDAYAECDKKVRDYLGSDFRTGRLWLGVAVPSSKGWKGGSRWFRCELAEKRDHENLGDTVRRTESLKGALRRSGPLNLACYQVKAQKDGRIDSRNPVICDRTHNSEFAGVFTAPVEAYPNSQSDWDKMHAACRSTVAKYVRLPDDGNLRFRTGTVVVPGSPEDWQMGNRGVRCYLYNSGKTFTRSLKGAGPSGLPVQ
jgi:hypothetical protein